MKEPNYEGSPPQGLGTARQGKTVDRTGKKSLVSDNRSLIRRGGAPSGTAKGCGEDFREKILDCGGVHRIFHKKKFSRINGRTLEYTLMKIKRQSHFTNAKNTSHRNQKKRSRLLSLSNKVISLVSGKA